MYENSSMLPLGGGFKKKQATEMTHEIAEPCTTPKFEREAGTGGTRT